MTNEIVRNRARSRLAKGIRIALIGIAALGVFGLVVMSLWNWLMPSIFGLRLISFWQALGLIILSKILFGGFHKHRRGGMHWRRRMQERWERMTPEEREKFQQGMRGHWCSPGPATEQKP